MLIYGKPDGAANCCLKRNGQIQRIEVNLAVIFVCNSSIWVSALKCLEVHILIILNIRMTIFVLLNNQVLLTVVRLKNPKNSFDFFKKSSLSERKMRLELKTKSNANKGKIFVDLATTFWNRPNIIPLALTVFEN